MHHVLCRTLFRGLVLKFIRTLGLINDHVAIGVHIVVLLVRRFRVALVVRLIPVPRRHHILLLLLVVLLLGVHHGMVLLHGLIPINCYNLLLALESIFDFEVNFPIIHLDRLR